MLTPPHTVSRDTFSNSHLHMMPRTIARATVTRMLTQYFPLMKKLLGDTTQDTHQKTSHHRDTTLLWCVCTPTCVHTYNRTRCARHRRNQNVNSPLILWKNGNSPLILWKNGKNAIARCLPRSSRGASAHCRSLSVSALAASARCRSLSCQCAG